MSRLQWMDHLPSGLRARRLLETIRAELGFPQSDPPGHFYSPIPARADVARVARRQQTTPRADAVPEVAIRADEQLAVLARVARHLGALAVPDAPMPGRRFYAHNDYFMRADALLFLGMLCEFQPRRYLEIGSGWSSALALDVRDGVLRSLHCTFVEPTMTRLRSLLRAQDAATIHLVERPVQEAPDDLFAALEKNDVLFVDGSHVMKAGSDLADVMFRILPILRPGVLIHFHDIPWPFEYREADLLKGRSWNEAYVLRAFLANSDAYDVRLFGAWIEACRPAQWSAFAGAGVSGATSLWLQKVRETTRSPTA